MNGGGSATLIAVAAPPAPPNLDARRLRAHSRVRAFAGSRT